MSELKVLLINSPTFRKDMTPISVYVPLGLLYLASTLKTNGIDTKLLDLNNKDCDINAFIKEYEPNVIGISCLFSGAFRGLKTIAQKINEEFPNIPIVIGGIHPTVFSKVILKKYDFIDYVILGEGEQTLLELIKNILKKSSLYNLDGIAFRENNDIKLIPKTRFIQNVDTLPIVDYSFIDINNYNVNTSKWYSPRGTKINQPYTIISSRSCPNKCNFCSMWLVHGPRFRPRSAKNVLDEIEHLYKDRGVRYFQFMDDNITLNRKRILEICHGIKDRNLNIQFDTPDGLAIKTLDEEVIDALIEAGLVYVSFGIESGSEYIRNQIMRKGLTTEKIYEIIEYCSCYNHLFIKGFFIIGMPQDTHDTLEDTYQMITSLPFDKLSVNFVAPYPGTELFDYCIQTKLLSQELEDYVETEIFQDTDEMPHFNPHNLSTDDLVKFRKKCFDYIKEKRSKVNVPNNYPMRYRE